MPSRYKQKQNKKKKTPKIVRTVRTDSVFLASCKKEERGVSMRPAIQSAYMEEDSSFLLTPDIRLSLLDDIIRHSGMNSGDSPDIDSDIIKRDIKTLDIWCRREAERYCSVLPGEREKSFLRKYTHSIDGLMMVLLRSDFLLGVHGRGRAFNDPSDLLEKIKKQWLSNILGSFAMLAEFEYFSGLSCVGRKLGKLIDLADAKEKPDGYIHEFNDSDCGGTFRLLPTFLSSLEMTARTESGEALREEMSSQNRLMSKTLRKYFSEEISGSSVSKKYTEFFTRLCFKTGFHKDIRNSSYFMFFLSCQNPCFERDSIFDWRKPCAETKEYVKTMILTENVEDWDRLVKICGENIPEGDIWRHGTRRNEHLPDEYRRYSSDFEKESLFETTFPVMVKEFVKKCAQSGVREDLDMYRVFIEKLLHGIDEEELDKLRDSSTPAAQAYAEFYKFAGVMETESRGGFFGMDVM